MLLGSDLCGCMFVGQGVSSGLPAWANIVTDYTLARQDSFQQSFSSKRLHTCTDLQKSHMINREPTQLRTMRLHESTKVRPHKAALQEPTHRTSKKDKAT